MSARSTRTADLLTVVTVVAMLVSVAVAYPSVITKFSHRATRNSNLNLDDRAFAAGNSIIPDKLVLYEARAYLGPGGTYRVLTGPGPIDRATPFTRSYAHTFATYFLMPSRPATDASLVICLGCETSQLGSHVHTIWSDQAGSSLLRVSR